MKKYISSIIFGHFGTCLVIALTLLVGACGSNSKAGLGADSASQFSANELAVLQDFHVWKFAVPQSQPPFKGVKLVLVKADKTSVLLFRTSWNHGLETPYWSNILLGFRYDGGEFSGRLVEQSVEQSLKPGVEQSPQMSVSWPFSLNFTNALARYPSMWRSMGGSVWNLQDGRAEIASFWSSEEGAKRGGTNDCSTLVVELEK